jgi:hypothetical protein
MTCHFLISKEPFYYFIPPERWDVVDPSKLRPMIKIAFVEHSMKPFKPSLNLGIQKTSTSLAEYLQEAKKQHLLNRNKKWNELGYVNTQAGQAHLSQIDEKMQVGDIRSMQCILVKEGYAYVITAVSLREDFSNYHNEFLKAFESFTICDDMLSSIHSEVLKATYHAKVEKLLKEWSIFLASNKPKPLEDSFTDKRFQRGFWRDFEKFLSKSFKDQGLVWQVMASKEVRKLLLENPS